MSTSIGGGKVGVVRDFKGDPRWMDAARELVDAYYYKVCMGAMANVIAAALQQAHDEGTRVSSRKTP